MQLGIFQDMGMKKSIVKGMDREQVVATMAKKLAAKGSTDFVVQKKKKLRLIYLFSALIAAVLITVILIICRSKSETPAYNGILTSTHVQSPLVKLRDSLANGKINIDQYGIFLKELLVNYDSLPPAYKTSHPVIKDTEVYNAFAEVWPRLSIGTRARITKALPEIQSKIGSKK